MSLRRKEIMVVDDSETNLILLQAVLEDAGYHVVLMDDPIKAVEYIRYSQPDLILLDLLMPDLDGFDFLKRLSNGSDKLTTPVVVVTAYSNEEYYRKAKELGALEIIDKPVNIPSLLNTVNKIIN